jgi:hypothetical protein
VFINKEGVEQKQLFSRGNDRTVMVFILISLLYSLSFASEDHSDLAVNLEQTYDSPEYGLSEDKKKYDNWSAYFGVSTLLAESQYKIVTSILFSSLTGSFGYHFNIAPPVLSPGVYGDLHLCLLTLFLNSEEDDKENDGIGYNSFQAGIRLYNKFRFSSFGFNVHPFIGLNLFYAQNSEEESMALGAKVFGVFAEFKKISLEYSYQHSIDKKYSHTVHRIAFLFNYNRLKSLFNDFNK